MVCIMEKILTDKLCDYSCNQVARYKFKNGKICCSKSKNSCPENKRIRGLARKGKKHTPESKEKMRLAKLGEKNHNYGKPRKKEIVEKISESNKGKKRSSKVKQKISKATKEGMKKKEIIEKIKDIAQAKKLTIKKINDKYPFFSRIEKLRYNPNKENEIQVRCKNNKCKKWFTPTYIQLYERIRQLEKDYGNEGCFFYCSDDCKKQCPMYNLKTDPYRNNIKRSYTEYEYQVFRSYVLDRDSYICQFCGELATDVHHERPQKLEPFFALDPDFAWSCCEKCHYEKGHKDECSTGNLAKKNCQKIRVG